MTVASFLALALAGFNRLFKLGLLSRLAERVTFVLIPPLVLIFLVLGTIFLGVATPTEGGAMGALGALIMAARPAASSACRCCKQALDNTAKLATFVLFILIGSTVFSFTFNAADGHVWVEHLFNKLPGGQLGFLIVVNLLVFVLGMFIDFFEIAFIVIPILAPVADKLGIDLIWFGVILAMNLQTSFLTPPFGFALFYLRSVAPKSDYVDRITGKTIPAVTTAQIYKGSIAFIVLQLIMVAAVVLKPGPGHRATSTRARKINAEDALQRCATRAARRCDGRRPMPAPRCVRRPDAVRSDAGPARVDRRGDEKK